MKVLAANERRPQDIIDIKALLDEAEDDDRAQAKQLLKLVVDRGFARKKNLLKDFEEYIRRYKP